MACSASPETVTRLHVDKDLGASRTLQMHAAFLANGSSRLDASALPRPIFPSAIVLS